jgi:hypothetical protein
MFRKVALAVILTAASAVSLSAQTDNQVPTPSVWKADLAASDFGGSPPPKSDTLYMKVDSDRWLSWEDVTVDADGKSTTISWIGIPDGSLRPVTGTKDMAAYQKNGDAHWALENGGAVDCTFLLSSDKKKATMDCTYKGKSGNEAQYKTVYIRSDEKESPAAATP